MRTKTGFRLRQIGDDYILMPEGTEQINFNKMITFNATAAYIWEETKDKDFDKTTIKKLLTDKYEISDEQAEIDAVKTIEDWTKAGLIE